MRFTHTIKGSLAALVLATSLVPSSFAEEKQTSLPDFATPKLEERVVSKPFYDNLTRKLFSQGSFCIETTYTTTQDYAPRHAGEKHLRILLTYHF